MDKQALVKDIREKRRAYSVMERLPWDRLIHDTVIDIASSYKVIGIYAALNGEVDTYHIIDSLLWDKTKTIVCPRIEGSEMNFYKISSLEDLKEGHFGVLEPIGNERLIPDLMITPMSAFNTLGYRIGYGKGYYDKYFAAHDCFRLGIAYDFQKLNVDFQDDLDVACHVIVTEKGIYHETENAPI